MALMAALSSTARAEQPRQVAQNPNPTAPSIQPPPGIVRPLPACAPGSTVPACLARRQTRQPDLAEAPRPPARTDDIRGSRFVPPAIQALLADRRIDPLTRAFLRGVSAKPTEDWTLLELQTVTQLAPTLAEVQIPTRRLSDFYEFLGLDPTQLFEPQLGDWQQQGTGLDRHSYDAVQQAQCLYLLGYGDTPDPSKVTLRDITACSAGDGT